MTETWRPIPGYEGIYDASDQGRIRSLDRIKVDKLGRQFKVKGRVLRLTPDKDGYPQCTLSKKNKQVLRKAHRLVLEAFVGPRPDGMVTRHLNDDRADPRLENLTYGTQAENCADALRQGKHRNQRKTQCPRDHEYTQENTRYRRGTTWRICVKCIAIDRRLREYKARKRAA